MIKSLLVLMLVGLNCFAFGQGFLSKKIDFQADNIPIEKALDQLAEETGIDIAYSKNFFKDTPPVQIDVRETSIEEILKLLLTETGIQFETLGENRVLLFKKAAAQFVVSGYVEDFETGERIPGAQVRLAGTNTGGITNDYGFFSIELPQGETQLETRSIGYKLLLSKIEISSEQSIVLKLNPADDLPKVIVDGRENTSELEYSSVTVDDDNLTEISVRLPRNIPTLNGEADYVRVAQMLPGIQAQSDGFGGVNIRGGDSGQNLMLMDGSPVYIPYHLMGLYSTYNPETVKSVKIVKGNFPARYGSAVSSVLDVRIREGDLYKWKATGNVSLLNAGLLVEGPIKKGKGSVLIAGRYSPMAYFFKPVLSRLYFDNQVDVLETRFHDLNIKANYQLTEKDHVYLSFFSGQDAVFQTAETIYDANNRAYNLFDLEWQNTVGSFRWNHLFSKKMFLNTTVTYSDYSNRFSSLDEYNYTDPFITVNDLFVIDNRSVNMDIGLKTDFDYAINNRHQLRFGLQGSLRKFTPNFYFFQETVFDAEEDVFGHDADLIISNYYDSKDLITYNIAEASAYVEEHIKLRRWYFNIGARLSAFINERDQYLNIEPRIITKYRISDLFSTSVALNRRMQYLHLIANPTIQLPNDLWLPSGEGLNPQELYEAELSFQYNVSRNLKLNLAGYYRQINNMYAYPESSDYLYDIENDTVYNFLVNGSGISKGIEFFADYSDNKRGLLFTYTLSKTERQFDSLNLGRPFAANFDSRHQINLAFHHKLSKSFKIGFNWVYNSPRPRVIILRFTSDGTFSTIDEPGFRNITRTTAYNRIDFNLQYQLKGKKTEQTFKVGVYNLLNRSNVAFHVIETVNPMTGEYTVGPRKSLPILPSFSYRISF